MKMAVTRDSSETISARLDRDAMFREALILETIDCLQDGDAETAKALARLSSDAATRARCRRIGDGHDDCSHDHNEI